MIDPESLAITLLTAIREQEASGWSDLEVLTYLRDRLREVLNTVTTHDLSRRAHIAALLSAGAVQQEEMQENHDDETNQARRVRGVGDAAADQDGAARRTDGAACRRSDPNDRAAVLYTDDDIDAGLGAIYNTTRLPNLQARELAQHVRALIAASRDEREQAAGAVPSPHREYSADELCPKCGVVLPCRAHQIPHPRVAPLPPGVDGQDLPQSDNEVQSPSYRIEVEHEDDGRWFASWTTGDNREGGCAPYSTTLVGALAELCATLLKVDEDRSVEMRNQPPSTNAVDPSAQPSGTPTPRDP